jgi:hypothetical protein
MSWRTGEVSGASAVTMAERTREGGCRRSEGGFSIPLGNYELLLAARLPPRFAITATHQSKTALHETNGPIAPIAGFPGPFGDVIGTKQALDDRAGSCRSQCGHRARALPRPIAVDTVGTVHERRTGGAPVERAPELARGKGANLEIIVDG